MQRLWFTGARDPNCFLTNTGVGVSFAYEKTTDGTSAAILISRQYGNCPAAFSIWSGRGQRVSIRAADSQELSVPLQVRCALTFASDCYMCISICCTPSVLLLYHTGTVEAAHVHVFFCAADYGVVYNID